MSESIFLTSRDLERGLERGLGRVFSKGDSFHSFDHVKGVRILGTFSSLGQEQEFQNVLNSCICCVGEMQLRQIGTVYSMGVEKRPTFH